MLTPNDTSHVTAKVYVRLTEERFVGVFPSLREALWFDMPDLERWHYVDTGRGVYWTNGKSTIYTDSLRTDMLVSIADIASRGPYRHEDPDNDGLNIPAHVEGGEIKLTYLDTPVNGDAIAGEKIRAGDFVYVENGVAFRHPRKDLPPGWSAQGPINVTLAYDPERNHVSDEGGE